MRRVASISAVLVMVFAGCTPFSDLTPAPSQATRPAAPTASAASGTPSAVPAPSSTLIPTSVPATPGPQATPAASNEPEPIDVPATTAPQVSLRVDGHHGGLSVVAIEDGDHRNARVGLAVTSLKRSRCRLVRTFDPDEPDATSTKERLEPVRRQVVALRDGLHTFRATCPSRVGILKATVRIRAIDQQPELCRGFSITTGPISISSLAELRAAIAGTWAGCVSSPYAHTPAYQATVTFRGDGTYDATSVDVIDGDEMDALYWFPDRSSPDKRFTLDELSPDLQGRGRIDLVKADGGVLAGDLRAVRLMNDRLMFELYNGSAGPLTFELKRP
jgi:hypothetical protein